MRALRPGAGSLLHLALIVRLGLHERLRWVWIPSLNPPAMFRRSDQLRLPLSLEHAYYPARSRSGIVLVPKDAYYRQAEELLERISREGEG
jgi:hypothetical protein